MPPPPDLHVVNRPIFAIKSRTYDGIRNPMKGLLAHTSARSFHIRRLNDIMHLCLQRGDFVRAKTAFATLARCNDIDAMDLWHVGMAVADAGNTNPGLQRIVDATVGPARIAFLKEIIVSTKYYRVQAMKELLLAYIAAGEFQEARVYLVDEYLPAYPRFDTTTIETYAGFISLQMAQSAGASQKFSQSLLGARGGSVFLEKNHLRNAKDHLETAVMLDKHNVVAKSFLKKLRPWFRAQGLIVSKRKAVNDDLDSDDLDQSAHEGENAAYSSSDEEENPGEEIARAGTTSRSASKASDDEVEPAQRPSFSPQRPSSSSRSPAASAQVPSPSHPTLPRSRPSFVQLDAEANSDHEDDVNIDDLSTNYGSSPADLRVPIALPVPGSRVLGESSSDESEALAPGPAAPAPAPSAPAPAPAITNAELSSRQKRARIRTAGQLSSESESEQGEQEESAPPRTRAQPRASAAGEYGSDESASDPVVWSARAPVESSSSESEPDTVPVAVVSTAPAPAPATVGDTGDSDLDPVASSSRAVEDSGPDSERGLNTTPAPVPVAVAAPATAPAPTSVQAEAAEPTPDPAPVPKPAPIAQNIPRGRPSLPPVPIVLLNRPPRPQPRPSATVDISSRTSTPRARGGAPSAPRLEGAGVHTRSRSRARRSRGRQTADEMDVDDP